MKKLFSLLLTVVLLSLAVLSVSAADVELSGTGKTLVTIGDWTYARTEDGSYWEIEEYRGSKTQINIPRIVNDTLVVKITDHCFLNNKDITSITTSSPLWYVGDYAFMNCTSLEYFECNFALKEIGTGAFSGDAALKEINLESSVITVVNSYTFLYSGIEEVTLPDSCTKIMEYAFSQCPNLSKITIPDSVVEIADNAFDGSDALVIYCTTDSYAHQYAVAKEIPFVLIDATADVTFILGDADGDGEVSIMDATKIQRVIAEFYDADVEMIRVRGNVDEDPDGLNISHATKIQRFLADYTVAEPIGAEVTRVIT